MLRAVHPEHAEERTDVREVHLRRGAYPTPAECRARRSVLTWSVQAYATTFEQVEKLRELMLAFVKSERRDFQPSFDITIVDFPEQASMTLSADIRYKSNWQQGALKGQSTHRSPPLRPPLTCTRRRAAQRRAATGGSPR